MFKLRIFLKSSLIFSFILATIIFTSCGKKGPDQKTDNKMDDVAVAPVDTVGAATGDWVVIREIADPEKMILLFQTTQARRNMIHISMKRC